MRERCTAFFVVLLLLLPWLSGAALAMEGAFLSGDDLQALEPSYEAFLDSLADLLIERKLLDIGERESWILYQIGDFLQNGGFGSMQVIYTPGLLEIADETVTAARLFAKTPAGTVSLSTLRRYSQLYSPLPGLPLNVALVAEDGSVVGCRFRWTASGGSFLYWNGAEGTAVDVGATVVSDGRALYWTETPVEGITETLTLALLHPEEDRTLATVSLTLTAGADFWSPEELHE